MQADLRATQRFPLIQPPITGAKKKILGIGQETKFAQTIRIRSGRSKIIVLFLITLELLVFLVSRTVVLFQVINDLLRVRNVIELRVPRTAVLAQVNKCIKMITVNSGKTGIRVPGAPRILKILEGLDAPVAGGIEAGPSVCGGFKFFYKHPQNINLVVKSGVCCDAFSVKRTLALDKQLDQLGCPKLDCQI